MRIAPLTTSFHTCQAINAPLPQPFMLLSLAISGMQVLSHLRTAFTCPQDNLLLKAMAHIGIHTSVTACGVQVGAAMGDSVSSSFKGTQTPNRPPPLGTGPARVVGCQVCLGSGAVQVRTVGCQARFGWDRGADMMLLILQTLYTGISYL